MCTPHGPVRPNVTRMSTLFSVIILALAAMSAVPAHGATLWPADDAGLRDDAPEDGVADSMTSTLWVYNNYSATTVAVMEYSVSAFTGQTLSVATVQGELAVNNANNVGVRTFLVKIYAGNGTVELSDYAIAATEVGQFSYAPPADTRAPFTIDMLGAAQALISSGATYIGVRVEPAGSDSPNVFPTPPTITLQTGAPPGPEAIAWTVEPAHVAQTGSGVDGTEFTPSEPITVTALGYYDDTYQSDPGLSVPHDVGIYNLDTYALVVSATVPAGAQAPLVDEFRFVEITPTDLVAGQTYVLAAVSNGDWARNAGPDYRIVDPRITVGAWLVSGSSSLTFPTIPLATESIFLGPTFLFTGESADDSDGDGVADGVDECPDTIPGVTVDAVGCPPPIIGDLDRDGDVDLDDYAMLVQCMSGTDTPADPSCGS